MKRKLYIVLWMDYYDGNTIGYLPFNQIPYHSILWKYIRTGEKVVEIDSNGIRGFYNDKELAEEHLKIEKKWRNNDHFKLIII